jgi:hypothetical protein
MGILGPELDLFIWNVLQNRKELAVELWMRLAHPQRASILVRKREL